MKKLTLIFILLTNSLFAQNAWINEIHYDNDGSDIGEAVEIVLENASSYSLSDFTITLYNGSATQLVSYQDETLDNFVEGTSYSNFTFFTWYPSSIQNGAPDGLSLDYQGVVLQFLSYEGVFTPNNGPASGIESIDIGVSETSTTVLGHSLQLAGTGLSYNDFTWATESSETFGFLNNGQSFSGSTSNVFLQFEDVSLDIQENDTTLNLNVLISSLDSVATTVDVFVNGGTADNGVSYIFSTATILFPPNSNQPESFSIQILDDQIWTGNQTIILGLQNTSSNASVINSNLIINIIEDEQMPTLSILDARGLTSGSIIDNSTGLYNPEILVTVSGVVTNGEELGLIRYIEDHTAGIGIYDPICDQLFRGDSVLVTGYLKDYNGLLEIEPVVSYQVISTGNNLPTPQDITPASIGEDTEGELIKLENITFNNGGNYFGFGYDTQEFTDINGETGVVFIRDSSVFAGNLIPVAPITLIAISSQFTFTNSGGYQILPRDYDDMILPSTVMIVSSIEQSNITTQSFDLSWLSSDTASTGVLYGTTENLELGEVTNSDSTMEHNLSLVGLNPGEFYYVKAFSVMDGDTAFSQIKIFSTESNSTGVMNVYFNGSVENSVSNGTDAVFLDNTFNDTIAAYIDRAQKSVDLAVYNNSNPMILTAINNAYDRGVDVRYISCESTANLVLSSLNPSIFLLKRPIGSGIMHNKFIVIDKGEVNDSWVITGSTNFSENNLFDDYNNLVIIQDNTLAKAYTLEFEEMWGSTSLNYDLLNSKFGPNKLDNTPHDFIVGGSHIELYFSPSDNTTSKIIEVIESTDYQLRFGLLAFTREDIANAIIDVNDNFGVDVKGLINTTTGQYDQFSYLESNNVNVSPTTNIPHTFHHKYCIVDQNVSGSDPLVLTGSHNWSNSAENDNDENTIIIHNQNIANQFFQEFTARWYGAVDVLEVNKELDMLIYPNPNAGSFTMQINSSRNKKEAIVCFDMFGKEIFKEEVDIINGEKKIKINVGLKSGIYFLQVGEKTSKLVIK